MDLLYAILQKGINLGATDIHLVPSQVPVYRVKKKLFFDESKLPLSKTLLENFLEHFYTTSPALESAFKQRKQADFSYSYSGHRFRVNLSISKSRPVFSLRIIPNGEININAVGLRPIIQKMQKIGSGLILVTGRVNSGKSTTMNAFIQEVNKIANKKIVTLEDPIEYEHESDKSIIVQKEIGEQSDVLSYYDGLINLLREDPDITVLGEIRDRKTMDVALDLAESGGLVIGTLHTRSCGETIERIINMYDPVDQSAIKNTVSSILKMVVSQKLVVGTDTNLLMVPEVMIVNNTIAAQIRQDKFSVSDIEDSIHSQRDNGCLSFEFSLADLYASGKIDMQTVKENIDPTRLDVVKGNIINFGGKVEG